MSDQSAAIDYTFTDEAPALATYSLLPVVRAFAGVAGIGVTSVSYTHLTLPTIYSV